MLYKVVDVFFIIICLPKLCLLSIIGKVVDIVFVKILMLTSKLSLDQLRTIYWQAIFLQIDIQSGH